MKTSRIVVVTVVAALINAGAAYVIYALLPNTLGIVLATVAVVSDIAAACGWIYWAQANDERQ